MVDIDSMHQKDDFAENFVPSNNKLLGEHRSTRDITAAKNASDIIQSLIHSLNFL